MSRKHFTAVVVGGGPAGATAAYALVKKGIETCLIDKRTFPRDKLCGGLLTLRSKKAYESVFEQPWDSTIEAISCGAQFFNKGERMAHVDHHSTLYFTQRVNFDNHLFRQAKDAGANTLVGQAIKEIRPNVSEVEMDDGSIITYQYLVGADGINSTVARTIFGRAFDAKKVGFALELELDADKLPNPSAFPEIHFGIARWGYGWVFPKKSSYTLGIGGIHSLNPDLREELNRFVISRIGYLPQVKVKGHFLPFGDFRKEPGRGNILLCGDAAGLVDSITGEGIAFAIQSGREAANAIYRCVQHPAESSVLDLYKKGYQPIAAHIAKSNFYRWFIFPKPIEKLFLWVLPDASTIQKGYLDLLADEIEYGTLPSLLWLQFKKGVRKGLRFLIPRTE